MQLIPVIDLKAGQVVHAIAGNREEYQPIVSQICESAEPLHVLQRLIALTAAETVYVADLDGICSGIADEELTRQLAGCGRQILLDAGFRNYGDLEPARLLPTVTPVISTESFVGFGELRGADDLRRLCCSVDLRDGVLQAADHSLCGLTPFEIVELLYQRGLRSLIILDVAAVGSSRGLGSVLQICRALRAEFHDLAVITGGGVHSLRCIQSAEAAGVDGLLTATALHHSAGFRSELWEWQRQRGPNGGWGDRSWQPGI